MAYPYTTIGATIDATVGATESATASATAGATADATAGASQATTYGIDATATINRSTRPKDATLPFNKYKKLPEKETVVAQNSLS